MSSSAFPRDPAGSSPQRVLALGGAVAVTAIALAGSLGFGPGAAASGGQKSQQTAGQSAAVGSGAAPTGSGVSAAPRSSGWLTVDTSPGDAAPGSASSGSAAPGSASSGSAAPGSASSGSAAAHGPGSPGGAGGPQAAGGGGSPAQTVPLPASSGSGRRVVYAISAQRVWLVDAGNVVERTYLVSGSRQADLLVPGTYAVYSRSSHAVSLNLKETMNYMVRFAHGDHAAIGFHDIPAYVTDGSLAQSRDDLGTPQSAGCIRQWEPDAKALWRFAGMGTSVVVTT